MLFEPKRYNPQQERNWLIKDCSQLLAEFRSIDGVLHARNADGRWRPLDSEVVYRIEELRWTIELSHWREFQQQTGVPHPDAWRYNQPCVRGWRKRLRVMLGKRVNLLFIL